MANKYLSLVSGARKLIEALTVSAGAADAGKIPALNAVGQLDSSMIASSGGGTTSITANASGNLPAGSLLSVTSSGTLEIASGSVLTKHCVGFTNDSGLNGSATTCNLVGELTGQTGLTVGGKCYLSATAGEITQTPLSGAGQLHQFIGWANTATSVTFQLGEGVEI